MLDEAWMGEALAWARKAAAVGEVPVGAVVVSAEGACIAGGHNLRETENDPTAHAEIVALQRAGKALGRWNLSGTTLFVTLEPCAMCAGALVLARVDRVVFGATDPKAGALMSLFQLGNDPRLNHRYAIEPGVREAECAAMLSDFFRALRRSP